MVSLWLDDAPTIETDAFEPGAHFDEVIVGAGLTGLATALMLAREGRRVAVVEARFIGSTTTGNTTAKLTQLQGTHLSKVTKTMVRSVTKAYADGQRDGFDWLTAYLESRGIPFERKRAVTYATTEHGASKVEREAELAEWVGLAVETIDDAGLPFATTRAVVLENQVQFDPLPILAALAADVRALGGRVFNGAPVIGVRSSSPAEVSTPLGALTADHVILATGQVILDRGLYFAKVTPHRSYALASDVDAARLPDGMFINAETPARSIRTWNGKLITEGNGHVVGRRRSPAEAVSELEQWTERWWPGSTVTHHWAAQDYLPPHHVPFVGPMPRGRGRILIATGFEKWGMTNAVAAALTLTADLLGGHRPWQTALRRRITTPAALASGLGANAAVGWWYLRGYAGVVARSVQDATPSEGEGVVGHAGLAPTAVSTVDGVTCAVSAICPHLHAIVRWNDAERSWDCPAHGSRFAADGSRLEGPVKTGLAPRA